MVNYWDRERERAIKILKFRIQHHEKHGNGKVAMDEKSQLIKLLKLDKDMKDKNK